MSQLLQVVLDALAAFWADGRTQTILILIVLNLGTGVMSALATHTFAWSRLGDFFDTRIVPFLLGYLLVYVFGAVWGATLPPDVRQVVQLIDQWAGAGVAIATLVAKILINLAVFRPAPPPTP